MIHADYHGAVVIPAEAVKKLPAAIDLISRREKVILDICTRPRLHPRQAARGAEAVGRDPLIRTRLTERLDIRHPVLLAPMGGVAGGRLAAAVTSAGGLGLIGGGYGDAAGSTANSSPPATRGSAAASSPGRWPASRSCWTPCSPTRRRS